jgi:hypothetical protein
VSVSAKNELFFSPTPRLPSHASGLNFRAGLGLGRAARAFYSVKQLKIAFRVGLGLKKFEKVYFLSFNFCLSFVSTIEL